MGFYNYNKIINSDKLNGEISHLNPSYIETIAPDILNIYFESELSPENKANLDSIIENHDRTSIISIPDVNSRQLRQALILSGISLDLIEISLDSLEEPERSLLKIEWEYSNFFQRNRPLASHIGEILEWTDEQLNNLWIFARTL